MRYRSLMKRLDRLTPTSERPNKDDDGFLTAVGALPGENVMEALGRQAATIWSDLNEDGKE